jgi:hypothetical protein
VIAPLDRVGVNLAAAVERAESKPRRRAPRRTLLFASGFAALVVLVGVPTYISLGGHHVAQLSTAEAIDQVAAAAESNPLPFAGANQFQYTRSRGSYVWSFGGGYNTVTKKSTPQYSALVTNERRAWVSLNRPGAFSEKRISVKWGTARDRRIAREQKNADLAIRGRPRVMGLAPDGRYYFVGKAMTRSELEKAPTDPKVIYDLTRKSLNGAGQGPSDGMWQGLTEPLYEMSFPPNVRAGMVRAIGMIPGVTTLGVQRDPLGREGIAISRVHAGVRDTLLFNQKNSAVLYQRSTVVQKAKLPGAWPVGAVVSDYLAYDQHVVNEMPASVRKKLPRPRRPVGTGVHSSVGLAD